VQDLDLFRDDSLRQSLSLQVTHFDGTVQRHLLACVWTNCSEMTLSRFAWACRWTQHAYFRYCTKESVS